jgi:hypothetical protein
MKHLVVFLVAIVTVVTMVGFIPATAGPNHAIPFKGSVDFTATSGTVLPDGSIFATVVGTGQVTHMGRVTADGTGVIHVDLTASGTRVLTAANGDQVFLSTEGTFASFFPPTSGVGTFTITGGTGRFMNATGGGNLVVVVDLTHFVETYDGTIQY